MLRAVPILEPAWPALQVSASSLSDHTTGCLVCCLQVAAELGYPYEDQEFVLEPDHGQWAEDIAFEGAKDDVNFGKCGGGEGGRAQIT